MLALTFRINKVYLQSLEYIWRVGNLMRFIRMFRFALISQVFVGVFHRC